MYLRAVHTESDIPTLRRFIQSNPLGILTTAIPSPVYSLIQSSHIPWVLDVDDESSETELGRLRGHMARQNPQSKAIIDSVNSLPTVSASSQCKMLEQEVLVLFNGPVHHYVTPKFYVETKPLTGKVVPTWNYSAVEVYGHAKIYFDSASDETSAFLSRQIDDLSQYAETAIMGYTGAEKGKLEAWKVADAPERYIELLKKSIIGIEVTIERLGGKFKMSQETGIGDREGVINGFNGLGSEVGMRMAQTVKYRGELKDM